MVTWPWVSRRAYDVVERERNTLAGALAQVTYTYNELVHELLGMKKDGYVAAPSYPEAQVPAQLPKVISDALDSIGLSGRDRDQMEAYAWRQLDRNKDAEVIASELIAGGLNNEEGI